VRASCGSRHWLLCYRRYCVSPTGVGYRFLGLWWDHLGAVSRCAIFNLNKRATRSPSDRAAGSTYRAFVANCFFTGEQWSPTIGGARILNKITLKLGRYHIEIVRNPENFSLSPSDARGGFHHTCDILVHGVTATTLQRAKALVNEIAELLSFATMSQVAPFGSEFSGSISRQSVRGLTLYFRPAIEQRGTELRRFLEQTWPHYHRLRLRRKLHIVFDYLVTSCTPEQPLEVKLLLSFVALESLKSTYARCAGYTFIKSRWRRNQTSAGFETLVREMIGQFNMRRSLAAIIKLRNQIVHHGMSRRPFNSQETTHFDTMDLIREYLLRLLQFKGAYWDYHLNARQIV